MELNSLFGVCAIRAVANTTVLHESTVFEAFKTTNCFLEDCGGSRIEALNDTLDELGIVYEDHLTNSGYGKALFKSLEKEGYPTSEGVEVDYDIDKCPMLKDEIYQFENGKYLIHIGDSLTNHTFGMVNGRIYDLSLFGLNTGRLIGYHKLSGPHTEVR
jgi:hypothetical protein